MLFDGVCALCNGFVKFIFRFDSQRNIKVAPLQSELGQRVLNFYKVEVADLTSVIVIKNGVSFEKYKGVVSILESLEGGWNILAIVMKVIPTVVGNFFYDIVAKFRYKVFGQYESCPIPSKDEASRFLKDDDILYL